MSPQQTGRRRKSSLRSYQYPGHTLDHTGKITSVAGGHVDHVVNFQIASEISQSFVPSRKYHSFFSSCKKFLNVQRYSNFSISTFYPAMFSDVRFQFILSLQRWFIYFYFLIAVYLALTKILTFKILYIKVNPCVVKDSFLMIV